ncbi:MAG: protease inhibitor I42 family protein [Tatlockia sp.]|nr:protease inhibitor I42 family protein [Tatlockia sp.]
MKILSAIFLFFFIGLTYASPMNIKVDKNLNQFQINLNSNPTTGFQWELINFDKSFLQLSSSQYIPSKTQLMGAVGTMQFNFKLITGKIYPTKTSMLFKYKRPWEAKGGTLKTVVVNFK